MTKEQLERGSDIEYEISQLKRHRPDGDGRVEIQINDHTVYHEGLRKAIMDYIDNRIEELRKEFEAL